MCFCSMRPIGFGLYYCTVYFLFALAESSKSEGDEQQLSADGKPKILMVRTENLVNKPFEQTQETKVSFDVVGGGHSYL